MPIVRGAQGPRTKTTTYGGVTRARSLGARSQLRTPLDHRAVLSPPRLVLLLVSTPGRVVTGRTASAPGAWWSLVGRDVNFWVLQYTGIVGGRFARFKRYSDRESTRVATHRCSITNHPSSCPASGRAFPRLPNERWPSPGACRPSQSSCYEIPCHLGLPRRAHR